MVKDIDVFILCGGKGKRLKKITGSVPKPMVEIGETPFLDILINRLRKFGFRRFILGIGYQADFIKKYYQKHKISGIKILFSRESAPLGTGGAVKRVKKFIKSDFFFVLNGDSYSDFNPATFIKFHQQKKAKVSILLRKVKCSKEYGSITTDKKSMITSFSEKDLDAKNNFINGGVYLFDKGIFSKMPRQKKFSLEYDFFPKMIGQGLYGYKKNGFFIDIGTPERYLEAKKHFLKK